MFMGGELLIAPHEEVGDVDFMISPPICSSIKEEAVDDELDGPDVRDVTLNLADLPEEDELDD
jgi:hypothetical protein